MLRHFKKVNNTKRNTWTLNPSHISPCLPQPLTLSVDSSLQSGALVLQRGMDGEKIDCVCFLCWTWNRHMMGGLGVKNICLKVVPAVEEVLVTSWGDALTHWQHLSLSCHRLRARWGALRRRLWQSVGTFDWPPLQAQDQLHQSLSCQRKE